MPTDSLDALLTEYHRGEKGTLNAQLPRHRKSLQVLLGEKHPSVMLSDGSEHYIKRAELDFLAGILPDDEKDRLLLPMLIEILSSRDEIVIRAQSDMEKAVCEAVLDMPVMVKNNVIHLAKSQLAVIRGRLKTTTQYVFVTSNDA